jgi:hypothetical protein
MINTQSFSYRKGRFERRCSQYRQNFGIKIIERRSSSANFVIEVLTTESDVSNPESNYSKFVAMFTKLCLKSGCNFVGVDSLFPDKSNNHSLIMFHDKQTLHGFLRPGWKDNFSESDTVKSNLIDLAFQKLRTVERYSRERQILDLSASGWGMHFRPDDMPVRQPDYWVICCSTKQGPVKRHEILPTVMINPKHDSQQFVSFRWDSTQI